MIGQSWGTAAKLDSWRPPSDALSTSVIEEIRGDPELERIAQFAADLCDCPTALLTLIDDGTQLVVAKVGPGPMPSLHSLALARSGGPSRAILEVPDARRDLRFHAGPGVTGMPQIGFFASIHLADRKGAALGTLGVIAPEPRAGLTALQRTGLAVLADAVVTWLEARRIRLSRQAWVDAAEADLEASEQRFRVLADAMPQMVWSTRPDGYHDYYNARWYAFTGAEPGDTDGTGWNGQFHPDDQERAWQVWQNSLQTGEPYEIEYRLRRFDGEYRWTLGRALPLRDAAGQITRWFGTCTDIHDQRRLIEERELLTRELTHRIRNIFTVIGSLIRLTTRTNPAVKEFGQSLSDQVTALGRAYDYIHAPEGAQAATLKGMLADLFAAYNSQAIERVRVQGDDIPLAPRLSTPLALTFHELVTNAIKYGALSREGGAIDLRLTHRDEQLVCEWQEAGGPSQTPGERTGFGTELMTSCVERQLGGTLSREWLPGLLKVTVTIPLA